MSEIFLKPSSRGLPTQTEIYLQSKLSHAEARVRELEKELRPIAWGIFGLFPASGGWCLQAGKVYTSQAAANDAYLGEYENSSNYMVMPLYTISDSL